MTQITIGGKNYKISYNFATATNFQRLTDKNPFDISKIDGNLQDMSILGYCMVLSNNNPDDLLNYDEFMQSIQDVKTASEFIAAINQELLAFFLMKNGDAKQEESDEPKND